MSVGAEPFAVLGEHFFLHGGLPVLARALRPVAQELNALRVGELEEVVRGRTQFRARTRKRRIGIDHLSGRIDGRALFAVVAVLVGSAAARAGALDEAVREEHALHGVVELLYILRVDEACGFEAAVDLLRERVVFLRVGRTPVVVADVKAVEVLLAAGGDFSDKGLRGKTALLGGNHDRRAVHVVCTDKMHNVAAHAFVTNPNVGLDVFHDVTHVEGAVRIGKSRGHEKFALSHVLSSDSDENFSAGASQRPDGSRSGRLH